MPRLKLLVLLPPQHPLPPYRTHPFSFPRGFQPVSPAKWAVGRTSLRMPVHTPSSMPPPQPRPLLTNARDTLHGDLPHALFEAAEPGVDLSDLGLFALYQLLDDLRKEEGSEGPSLALAPTLPGPVRAHTMEPSLLPSPRGRARTKVLAPPHIRTCRDVWCTSTRVLTPPPAHPPKSPWLSAHALTQPPSAS